MPYIFSFITKDKVKQADRLPESAEIIDRTDKVVARELDRGFEDVPKEKDKTKKKTSIRKEIN